MLSCSSEHKRQDNERKPVLEVEGRFLYLDEIQNIVPNNVSSQDSTLLAESYIKKWVTDILVYERAKRNISNKEEIDKLVEDYRKTLVLQQYQQSIIEQQLNADLSDEQLQEFYTQYTNEFVLSEPIIKGLFLKVPMGAPNLQNLRGWLNSLSSKSLENIERYCVQNASTYDYFADRWVNLSEVSKNISIPVGSNDILSKNRLIEVQDSTFRYFLFVQDYKAAGATAPFDAAKEKIRMSLINKKRIDFIKNFQEEIYQKALKKGDINFFD
jgi:hypothetical protein